MTKIWWHNQTGEVGGLSYLGGRASANTLEVETGSHSGVNQVAASAVSPTEYRARERAPITDDEAQVWIPLPGAFGSIPRIRVPEHDSLSGGPERVRFIEIRHAEFPYFDRHCSSGIHPTL